MGFATRLKTWTAEVLTASDLNTEFNIPINALSDGTKDANVAALTASSGTITTLTPTTIAGNANFTGTPTFGNATVTTLTPTTIAGNVNFTGNPTFAANVTLGDAAADLVTVNSQYVKMNATSIAKTEAPVLKAQYGNNMIAAWASVSWDGSSATATVSEGFNVNTITNMTSASGRATFHTALPDANYAVHIIVTNRTDNTQATKLAWLFPHTLTTTTFDFYMLAMNLGSITGSQANPTTFTFIVVR